ncbi:MAG: hypothetical protein MdMp014T_2628 [Treponematales bacterium]
MNRFVFLFALLTGLCLLGCFTTPAQAPAVSGGGSNSSRLPSPAEMVTDEIDDVLAEYPELAPKLETLRSRILNLKQRNETYVNGAYEAANSATMERDASLLTQSELAIALQREQMKVASLQKQLSKITAKKRWGSALMGFLTGSVVGFIGGVPTGIWAMEQDWPDMDDFKEWLKGLVPR